MSNEWRRVVAALDHPDRRRVYAEVVLGLPGTPGAKRDKSLAALQAAGLVDAAGRAIPTAFAALLADTPPSTRQGLERWVRDGVITDWPSRPADRAELLAWVRDQVAADAPLGERDLTDRLAALTRDPVGLRRELIDAGLLVRTADGAEYRRV